jgi:hypothetical protein
MGRLVCVGAGKKRQERKEKVMILSIHVGATGDEKIVTQYAARRGNRKY